MLDKQEQFKLNFSLGNNICVSLCIWNFAHKMTGQMNYSIRDFKQSVEILNKYALKIISKI